MLGNLVVNNTLKDNPPTLTIPCQSNMDWIVRHSFRVTERRHSRPRAPASLSLVPMQHPAQQSTAQTTQADSGRASWIWCVLGLLLILLVPLVVRAPLTSDTVMFDLQAKTVSNGGVLYQNILEPNFPGVVWVHMMIRGIGGWSPTWMRIADLLIVLTSLLILFRLAAPESRCDSPTPTASLIQRNHIRAAGTLTAVFFYLTRNEWCHCQRDCWMLLPVSAAIWLHCRRAETSERRRSLAGIAEGLCWGAAFWIKPHIAFGALPVFAVTLLQARDLKTGLRDLFTIVSGGILAAVPGIIWLLANGSFTAFLDMQVHWNPEYLAAGAERRSFQRIWHMIIRFHPWWLVHLAALPIAISQLRKAVRRRSVISPAESRAQRAASILSALYVGWLVQALLLQHAMDYIHVAPIILGIAVLSSRGNFFESVSIRSAALAFAVLAIAAAPFLHAGRLTEWPECVASPRSWRQLETLSQGRFPDWQDVGQVVDFLRREQVRQGDVTCFTTHSIHIYAALQMMPSTRYVGVSTLLELFPRRADKIRNEVTSAGARFIVTDDDEVPPQDQAFPWDLPVVFRSGSIAVHAVRQVAQRSDSIRTQ